MVQGRVGAAQHLIKSGEQTQNLFANGTIGMLLGGDWQIPFLNRT